MCTTTPYKVTDGSFHSYKLHAATINSGCAMTDALTKLKGGKIKGGKKRYRYSNGVSHYVRKKLHKTRRSKTNLSRRLFQNPFPKKGRSPKTLIQRNYTKKYGRPKRYISYGKSFT